MRVLRYLLAKKLCDLLRYTPTSWRSVWHYGNIAVIRLTPMSREERRVHLECQREHRGRVFHE